MDTITEERHALQAEVTTLDRLMSRMPEANVIDRLSLEARKREVERALSALNPPYYEPARSQLIFHGKPTVKNRGIYADFAAGALDKYANMIAVLGSNQTTDLGSYGPIPNKDEYQLMIIGTVLGSFGFEIEEVTKQESISSELSPIKAAMEKANLIMRRSGESSDDDIAEVTADISTRSIEAIRAFLEVMEAYEAVFAIDLGDDKSVQFDNIEQIKKIRERLKPENIREDTREFLGKFQGVLPKGRAFEFLAEECNEIIRGQVGQEIENASDINHFIEKPMKIRVHTRQVGSSRLRYTLISYEETGSQLR